jgi:violaxanthin de-epoxidase
MNSTSRMQSAAVHATSLPLAGLHPRVHRSRPSTRLCPTSALPTPTPEPSEPTNLLSKTLGTSLAALATCALIATPLSIPPSVIAADNAQVGTCVLQNCQGALAQCLGDLTCVENLVCLQACNGRPDETECQIRCGDRYQDKAIDVFNTCAVSEKKCVPQKVDEGVYPVPSDCALDKKFDLSKFQGRWYISAGLNTLFDTFPCQEHFFATPKDKEGIVYAEINWRIPVGDNGDFMARSTMQKFVQEKDNPAIMLNHGNEYLHYEDDWYIIGSKPDEYVFVYYRGQNDAWKGYGGATVYTRSRSLPVELIPELKEKAEAAGLDWSKFTITDNTCPAKPPARGPLEELKEDIVTAERFVDPQLKSFGRGFTILEQDIEEVAEEVVKEVEEEEAVLAAEVKKEAQAAARLINRFRMEAEMDLPEWLRALPMEVKEFVMPMRR